jgi:hypothetical protein
LFLFFCSDQNISLTDFEYICFSVPSAVLFVTG